MSDVVLSLNGTRNGCGGVLFSITATILPPSPQKESWESFFDGKPVRTIGEGAFAGCTDLCGVFLPHGLQVIGKRAFAGCTGLRSLILPGTLEHIGESAFSGCCALTEFRYAAVAARWETVRKESGWDEGLPMYLLVCRDRSIGK